MVDLTVTVAEHELAADWTSSNATTRNALAAALPVSGEATRWGDELYFNVLLDTDPTQLRTAVSPGTIAYWPAGPALCLFWGPTPASTDDTPVAASPVAPLATLRTTDPLDGLQNGASVRIDAHRDP